VRFEVEFGSIVNLVPIVACIMGDKNEYGKKKARLVRDWPFDILQGESTDVIDHRD